MSIDRRPSFEHYKPQQNNNEQKKLTSLLGELTEAEREIVDNPLLETLRSFSSDVDVKTIKRPPWRRIP